MANRSGVMELLLWGGLIWIVTADPVEYLLPVPMPELVAGPETTRLDDVPVVDGVPDYAAVMDARNQDLLHHPTNALGPIAAAVGTLRWTPAEREAIAPWLMGRQEQRAAPLLVPDPPADASKDDRDLVTYRRQRFDTVTDRTEWQRAAASGRTALAQLPDGSRLIIPWLLTREPANSAHPSAAVRLSTGLDNLARAALDEFSTIEQPEDLRRRSAEVLRIVDWLADSQEPEALHASIDLCIELRRHWLDALARHPEPAWRAVIADRNVIPALDPRPALIERAHWQAVELVSQRCAAFRRGDVDTAKARRIRRNAPPDPNAAVAEVHRFSDILSASLASAVDIPGLAAIPRNRLPEAFNVLTESFDHRPLAEQIIFARSVAERRVMMGQRFAGMSQIDLLTQTMGAQTRAQRLLRRQHAVEIALASLEFRDRTGQFPRQLSDLPEHLRPYGDGAMALILAGDGTSCSITTSGKDPATLWQIPPAPATKHP